MNKKIVVVGSINMDMVASVKRMPHLGETMTGSGFATYPGGKGANQAVAAGRLGAPVAMIGRLGEDVFAAQLRESLTRAGVEVQGVPSVTGPSGCAVILTTSDGDNSIVVIPGANHALTPDELSAHSDVIRRASIILAQLETPIETIVALGQLAQSFNVPFLLDPAPVCALPAELLSTVTWITPNETETAQIMEQFGVTTGKMDRKAADQAARTLLDHGVRNVLIKLGSDGVFMEGADVAPTTIPAYSVRAVDTTAAGDAFNGAFGYALAVRRMDPIEAARFASAVAAISVTRAGAQPSMPTLNEVEDFLKSHERQS